MIFTVGHSIILAITEALTEFLPISSSAHLILVRELLHIQTLGTTDLAIDAVFQMGAIIAVLLYFWTDIKKIFIDTPLKSLVRQPVSGEESNMFTLMDFLCYNLYFIYFFCYRCINENPFLLQSIKYL